MLPIDKKHVQRVTDELTRIQKLLLRYKELWIFKERFVLLVIVIVIVIGSIPLLEHNPWFSIVSSIFFMIVLISVIMAVSETERSLKFGLTLGAIAFISFWIYVLTGQYYFGFIVWVFFIYATIQIIITVFNAKKVTLNVIFGGIAGYLLIGYLGANIIMLLYIADENSFTLSKELGDSLPQRLAYYFSFTTMTTLGYGDITPTSPAAQTLALYLAVVGPLYLTILVAILVGKYISQSIIEERLSEIETSPKPKKEKEYEIPKDKDSHQKDKNNEKEKG
jgi:hypothetical protein